VPHAEPAVIGGAGEVPENIDQCARFTVIEGSLPRVFTLPKGGFFVVHRVADEPSELRGAMERPSRRGCNIAPTKPRPSVVAPLLGVVEHPDVHVETSGNDRSDPRAHVAVPRQQL
jgi:hypothetical protein